MKTSLSFPQLQRARFGALGRGGELSASRRLAHVATAALVSVLLAFLMFLQPLDWMIWKFESRLVSQRPSGEIGYLHLDPLLETPRQRTLLAETLDRLRERGVERVFLNVALVESFDRSGDARLLQAMDAWGQRLVIVNRIVAGDGKFALEDGTAKRFSAGHPVVLQEVSREWPGFVWRLPYAYDTEAGRFPAFGAALARVSDGRTGTYQISYAIRSRTLPRLDQDELLAGSPDAANGGTLPSTIVLGTTRSNGSGEYVVPVQVAVEPSYVDIYAAETLLRRPMPFIPGAAVALFIAVLMAGASLVGSPRRRRVAYGAVCAIPAAFFLASVMGWVRVELSYTLVLLAIVGIGWGWRNWKNRLTSIDPDTGLPSLRACRNQLAAGSGGGFVVVAKIQGFETIMRSFDAEQRTTYVIKLVERLRIADPRLPVFVDGHYLAWLIEQMDETNLRGHLEGLRAIFAAPVLVDTHSVDVGITFGAAQIGESHPERALAAALEAVEETTEALEPIRISSESLEDDSLWDISLRARIDAAMDTGEVFCVYQPKVDIVTNAMVGVEALVRWKDPERGYISPAHFVQQCEKAGRMEYLTRYVLQSACSAGRLLHFRGATITMAVNISATLLTDMRIVGILRNVLQATEFDPAYLVLEITETARIRDFDQARTVLLALKGLGARISMDDFGAGAANFEALQALPIDEIKIDRQFVARAARDAKARAITASLVRMGADSRIAVVAEGAETPADIAMLREIGCRQVQGFALSHPMPLTKLLISSGTDMDSKSG